MIHELEEWCWSGAGERSDSIVHYNWIWGLPIAACLITDGINILHHISSYTFPHKIVVQIREKLLCIFSQIISSLQVREETVE